MEQRVLYFLIINTIAFGLVLVYVRYRRKKTQKEKQEEISKLTENINTEYYKQTKGTDKDYRNIEINIDENLEGTDPSRPVNVVFTWNGHDWDAYEVLGVPAGSTLTEVREAYEKALEKVDNKSQKFIEKAYRSICQKAAG